MSPRFGRQHLFFCGARSLIFTVKDSEGVRFAWRQLLGDDTHLLADVILAYALGEASQASMRPSWLFC